MGQSHIDSNMIAKDGTEYIASFAAIKTITTMSGITTISGTTSNFVTASSNVIKASGLGDSSYMQIGAQQYLFVGNANTGATVVAEATALVATPIKGSLYLGRKGNPWYLVSDSEASQVNALG